MRQRTLPALAVLWLLLCWGPAAIAQAVKVEGHVRAASGNEPLPGVTVSVEGTSLATATDLEGHYLIEMPGPVAVLVFRQLGMATQRIEVKESGTIDVLLEEDRSTLGEVVVIGY